MHFSSAVVISSYSVCHKYVERDEKDVGSVIFDDDEKEMVVASVVVCSFAALSDLLAETTARLPPPTTAALHRTFPIISMHSRFPSE